MSKIIKVIIVDDSPVCTQLLRAILEEDPDIQVVACANDGETAVNLAKQLKPDLITMDIFMPKMNGVEATRIIMDECPTPIVMISSHANDKETTFVFNALEAGALSVIEKPQSALDPDFSKVSRHIVNVVRTLSGVHVMRRRGHGLQGPPKLHMPRHRLPLKICALGSSTGGPAALNAILSSLPAQFPVPLVVTQHIAKGFLSGLLHWLQAGSKLHLEIAKHRQPLLPGCVYFADDNAHLVIQKGATPIAILDTTLPTGAFMPSINALFSSLATSYPEASIGGLLTGMGSDGVEGLLKMREAGCITFAQSEATCVVYGMPGVAVSSKATDCSIDLENISHFLATLIDNEEKR